MVASIGRKIDRVVMPLKVAYFRHAPSVHRRARMCDKCRKRMYFKVYFRRAIGNLYFSNYKKIISSFLWVFAWTKNKDGVLLPELGRKKFVIIRVVLANEQDEMAVMEEHREVVTIHLMRIGSAYYMFLRFFVQILKWDQNVSGW